MADYIPHPELPIELRQQQERFRRQFERESAERTRLHERDRKAKEAEEMRAEEIIAARESEARRTAAETKAAEARALAERLERGEDSGRLFTRQDVDCILEGRLARERKKHQPLEAKRDELRSRLQP
jgi:hypothetical protein